MDNLNEEQYKAVSFNGKHLLVLAGAGTGKTRTIIARAKYLIENGTHPKRILILSFTRKSAKEIAERIKSSLSSSNVQDLQGQTFHSWCMNLIKNNPSIFPFHDYTLLDEDDRGSCFKLLCGKNFKDKEHRTVKPSSISDVYSYAVNTKCSLSESMRVKLYDNASMEKDTPESKELKERIEKNRPVYSELIKRYISYKTIHKYLDYDDLINLVSKSLKSNEDVKKYINSLYDHILVDEMQDTNPLQYELLSSFYDKCHLFCVGDDAQSIYAFRGADFKSIHHFAEVVQEAEVYKLETNYRSTQEILDISNWLLSQSKLSYGKELKSFRGNGESPKIIHWDNEWDEANYITDKIQKSTINKGVEYGDNMVLSRSVFGLRKVEACCMEKKIPCKIFGGSGLMQSKHVRDLASSMRIVANHKDELAWMRYLMLWKDIGEITASKIIGDVIMEEDLDNCLFKLMGMGLQNEISETLVNISNLQYNPSDAISKALETMEGRLQELYKEEWKWRKEDFTILKEVALSSGGISEFVAEYVLDPKLEVSVKAYGKDEDYVRLTTIHQSKGLEAKICYIVNVSTFSFPTPRSILNGDDSIEEERRCLYVAMTRAKDELYICRDIHTTHIDENEEENGIRYFLNNIPDKLFVKDSTNNAKQINNIAYTGETVNLNVISDFDYN
ncbi:MAG: ATP-dependent helicase [Bacteroides sp.]